MRALLRKDAIWLVFLGVAGLLVGLLAMGSEGVSLWYRPDDNYGPGSLIFLWIAGGVLGLCAGLFEDFTFTREYLLHRPVSAARLFWTRQLGCGVALLSWIVVAPALHLAGSLLFDKDASLVEADRYWRMLNQGTVGFAFYAVALFAATLVRRWLLAIIVAAAVSTALLMFFGLALYNNQFTPIVYRLQAPISLAIAVPLLLAALRISREGRDLDRPGSRARLAAATCALVLFSVAGSAFLHILQVEGRRDVMSYYPKMARLPGGQPILVGTKAYGRDWPVDEQHRRLPGTVQNAEYVFEARSAPPLRQKPRSLGEGGRSFHGVRYRQTMCNIPARCYLGSDGRLHLYRFDFPDEPTLVKHVGKADGSAFSSGAFALGYWGRVALVVDPQDAGIWRYGMFSDEAGFTRLPLPGDDRFVEELSGLLRLPRQYESWQYDVVVRGERGIYLVERDTFKPASPEVLAAVAELDRRRARPEPQVTVTGPVHFQVSVPGAGAEPPFQHSYAPHTFFEWGIYLPVQGLSLLRAPVLTLTSLVATPNHSLGNPTDNDARILLDPLVLQGSRWALALNLLVAGALGTLTFRRLGQLKVPAPRRAFWTTLVATTGVLGYVVYRTTENRRAWHPLDVTQARPPLLIKSAA